MDYGSKMSKHKWLQHTEVIVTAVRIVGAVLTVVAREVARQFGFNNSGKKGGKRQPPK